MKYIDADKLIAEIERLREQLIRGACAAQIEMKSNCKDEAYNEVLSCIASLQQEQYTCKTCGFYENNCPFIRGKLISYPNKVCKDYTYSITKKQEQQEMDLVKYISNKLRELGADLINHKLDSFNDGLNVGRINGYYDILGWLKARKEE